MFSRNVTAVTFGEENEPNRVSLTTVAFCDELYRTLKLVVGKEALSFGTKE